jgi:predicted proteasome-type protease
MTVCVAACVHDGLVFAADSATSLVGANAAGQAVIERVYQHGNKVFNLDKRLPVVAMTSGLGAIGNAPIHSLAKDLRREFKATGSKYELNADAYTIEEITQKAHDFLYGEKYSAIPKIAGDHSLEFWIGGYSSNSDAHELFKITIINGSATIDALCKDGECQLFWGGQPNAINRLVIGYDNALVESLRKVGVSDSDLPGLMQTIRSNTEAPLMHPGMPVQDAIELCNFLVETTKGFVRFLPGADTVGGEVDIAVVTRHERFKWIKRKHYYSRKLNKLETDHV